MDKDRTNSRKSVAIQLRGSTAEMMDDWTRAFLLENLNEIMPTDDWIAYEESEYDCDDPDDYLSESEE